MQVPSVPSGDGQQVAGAPVVTHCSASQWKQYFNPVRRTLENCGIDYDLKRNTEDDVVFGPSVRTLLPAAPREGGLVHLLFEVIAPPRPRTSPSACAATRSPLRLALVLDGSSTMVGEPLGHALQCIGHLILGLEPNDQVGLVVMRGNRATTAFTLQSASNAYEAFAGATTQFAVDGDVPLEEGWTAAAQMLAKVEPGTLARVVLFSSGKPVASMAGQSSVLEQLDVSAANGVSTSVVVLGLDCDEGPIRCMAGSGGGLHYFNYPAAMIRKGLEQEFGLPSPICWDSIRLRLRASRDVVSVEPPPHDRSKVSMFYLMPAVPYGFRCSLLLQVHLGPDESESRILFSWQFSASGGPSGFASMIADLGPELRNVDAETFSSLPEDKVVAARIERLGGQTDCAGPPATST